MGVIGEAVPRVATAAIFPPLPGPCFGGHLHCIALEAICRIAGHDIKAPGLFAGGGMVCGDVAPTGAVFRASVANQHLVLEDLGRTRDIERLLRVGRLGTPQHVAIFSL